jgi:hypothetical protein
MYCHFCFRLAFTCLPARCSSWQLIINAAGMLVPRRISVGARNVAMAVVSALVFNPVTRTWSKL